MAECTTSRRSFLVGFNALAGGVGLSALRAEALPTTGIDINDPKTVQEVKDAFAAQDHLLAERDSVALNKFFFDSPLTVRFGGEDIEYGYEQIAQQQTKNAQSGAEPQMTRDHTVITTFGQAFATVCTLTRYASRPGKVGRNLQTWVRFPQGWKIVAAHISVIDTPAGYETH